MVQFIAKKRVKTDAFYQIFGKRLKIAALGGIRLSPPCRGVGRPIAIVEFD